MHLSVGYPSSTGVVYCCNPRADYEPPGLLFISGQMSLRQLFEDLEVLLLCIASLKGRKEAFSAEKNFCLALLMLFAMCIKG